MVLLLFCAIGTIVRGLCGYNCVSSYSPIQSLPIVRGFVFVVLVCCHALVLSCSCAIGTIVRGFWNFDLGVGGRSPTPDHLRPHFPNPSRTLLPFGIILSHANSFFLLAQFFPISFPFTFSTNRATLPNRASPIQCPLPSQALTRGSHWGRRPRFPYPPPRLPNRGFPLPS
jgi:hypothetical protein